MEIQAAVFRKVLEPLTIEAVDIDKPLGREVLVRTVATGVCHSDLHVVDGVGRFPLDRPIVLGHEGAGIVEAVGPDVTTVRPGDINPSAAFITVQAGAGKICNRLQSVNVPAHTRTNSGTRPTPGNSSGLMPIKSLYQWHFHRL
jgi:S-(hydroxymethyl)glutathione dehydrogenase / alcohol dehydrogenase